MLLYPKKYINRITDIDLQFLKDNNIKGLILDVDNTLIDYDKKILDGVDKWVEEMKNNNIKLCILSNTNKIEKVTRVAKYLDLKFINFAKKPSKSAFNRAKKLLEIDENETIGVVGDQVFTDVFGGNRMNMFTILTKPIDERDILITRFKRPFEKIVIKKYLKETGDKNVF